MAEKLKTDLSKLIVRKKQDGGEFAYLIKSTGKEIAGKKLAFMLLKNDPGFSSLKKANKTADESDEDFEAKVTKILPTVPFGGGTVVVTTAKTTPKASPKVQPTVTPKKVEVVKDYEKLTKDVLFKLVARRKLDGGQFTYVYRPLEKAVTGKKTLLNFLKNQEAEYTKLQKTKNPSESDQEFTTRVLQILASVPFETETVASDPSPKASPAAVSKAQKRKGDAKKAPTIQAPKRSKLDLSGSLRTVYLDLAIFSSKDIPAHICQIGAVEDKPNNPKKFFRAVYHPKFLRYSESTLEKLNMRNNTKGILFKKHNFDTMCCEEAKALAQLLSFLETVKNNFKNLSLVVYRREALYHLLKALDNNQKSGLVRRFAACVTSVVCIEDLIEEGELEEHKPMKHIKKFYSKVLGASQSGGGKKECAEDYADMLMNIMVRIESEISTIFGESGEGSNDCYQRYVKKGAFTPKLKITDEMFTVTNSQNFLSNEQYLLEKIETSSASTSKVSSVPPPKPQQAQSSKKSAKKAEMEVMEVEEEEEDPNSFTTVGSDVLFPVLSQPVLVRLGEVDENTKFVKFSLSKEYQEISQNKWRTLPSSSKVFWKADKPYAFLHLCPEDSLLGDKPFVKPVQKLGLGTALGTFRSLNKTDEEQRNLSTKVSVELVVDQLDKISINKGQKAAVPVKLMLKQGSLTNGSVKDFVIRPSDVLIMTKANVPGLEFVNNFVAVDKKPLSVNSAKVIVTAAAGKLQLKEGQIIGTSTLFQNDVKLVFSKMAEQGEMSVVPEVSETDSGPKKLSNQKMNRSLKTIGASRLYAQGSNSILVRLDQYQASKLSSKFNKACIKFSPEFTEVIDKNKNSLKIEKLKEKDSVVKVYWKGSTPYAFIDIRIAPGRNKGSIDFCDIISDYNLGMYAPMDYCKDIPPVSQINMMVCVDFLEKNVVVDNQPKLVKVYLKFKDAEVDKQQVIEECFSITRVYNSKLEVLSLVFKPDSHSRLAPQKTATNDMKAVLVVKTKNDVEGVVSLNPREVMAECCSLVPEDNLKRFAVCGKKVMIQQDSYGSSNDDFGMMDQGPQMGQNRNFSQGGGRMDVWEDPMSDMMSMGMGGMRSMGPRNGGYRPPTSDIHNPFEMDLPDRDYMNYRESMGQGLGMGGGPQTFSRGGARGGIKSRLGAHAGGIQSRLGSGHGITNPMFDASPFNNAPASKKASVFAQAKAKLNSGRGGSGFGRGGRGSFKGAQGPPKKGTWSS